MRFSVNCETAIKNGGLVGFGRDVEGQLESYTSVDLGELGGDEAQVLMPSSYFSLTVKSRYDPFLEPTSTKQLRKSFMLMETTGVFVGLELRIE